MAKIQIDDYKSLVRLRRDFVIGLENCTLVPTLDSDLSRVDFPTLFWWLYYFHNLSSAHYPDSIRKVIHSRISSITDEMSRRFYLDFIDFSDDLPD